MLLFVCNSSVVVTKQRSEPSFPEANLTEGRLSERAGSGVHVY